MLRPMNSPFPHRSICMSTPTDLHPSTGIAGRLRPALALLTIATLAVIGAACKSQPTTPALPVTEDTYAVVNGRQITRADVDKAYQRGQPSSQTLSEEETLVNKLRVLDELILQDLLLARGRELKVDVAQADVDEAYEASRRNVTQQAIDEELARRNLTAADVREGLRRELVSRKVLDRDVVQKVQIPDAAVTAFFDAHRAEFNLPEDSYRLAQIVVTPTADPQSANRAGDDAVTPQQAQQKAAGLMRRLREGAAFDELARDHSEDPQTAARGGDLGLIPAAALNQIAPALRDAVLKSAPGAVTAVNVNGVHTLVLVMGLEKAGQRDISMPAVRENIVANLRGRKEQLLRAAYLTKLRSDAQVVNYFARRLVERESAAAATETKATDAKASDAKTSDAKPAGGTTPAAK